MIWRAARRNRTDKLRHLVTPDLRINKNPIPAIGCRLRRSISETNNRQRVIQMLIRRDLRRDELRRQVRIGTLRTDNNDRARQRVVDRESLFWPKIDTSVRADFLAVAIDQKIDRPASDFIADRMPTLQHVQSFITIRVV